VIELRAGRAQQQAKHKVPTAVNAAIENVNCLLVPPAVQPLDCVRVGTR
jgi:hypothetical protein